jgi:hypothetical protein
VEIICQRDDSRTGFPLTSHKATGFLGKAILHIIEHFSPVVPAKVNMIGKALG